MSGRFDVFHSLEPEKQKRILDAALREFADKGFKRASTNAARIGKGMLFYYFGSKEELFDFLCEYTMEFARNTYLPPPGMNRTRATFSSAIES
ncbi:MAG: TetR/AcrR family transcriptional regulator [Clostridium sp.]|nr:TetR/AcrR family transcriptional regulator [Clostridium sp.]